MTKRKSVLVCLLIAMFSFLLFGCKQNIKVENIYFNAPSADGVVLLVGETYAPEVYFSPRYPTNKAYKITSYNDSIVSVRNNQITALTAGKTYLKVVADENDLIQDIMQVQVVANVTKLSTPTITYSAEKQSFTISQSNQDSFVNGYTIEINGESINIGNVLEYSLNDYNKHLQSSVSTTGVSAYDRDLTVRVKATVPTYTNAFEDSNFSQTIKINQASAPKSISVIGGKLNIEKSKARSYQVYVNGTLFTTTANAVCELSAIDKSLAGSELQIMVYAVGTAGEGFTAYNSSSVSVSVKCVEDLNVVLLNETVSWQALGGVKSYEIYLGNQRIASVESNYYNLTSFADFDTAFTPKNEAYELKVKPVLADDAKNLVMSTEQGTSIELNRLEKPTISCTTNMVKWNAVNNATHYQVKVVNSSNEVVYEIVTDKREIDFTDDRYLSGESYTITVNANFVDGKIYYLASASAAETVEKQAMAEFSIENYVLKLNATLEHQYKFQILDANKQSLFGTTITAFMQEMTFNILNLGVEFDAGEYDVRITHLGDGSRKIDAKTSSYKIVCLQEVNKIIVENGIVSASAGELNLENNAVLKFDLTKGSTVVTTFESTTNLNELNLAAGEYVLNLYVLGDGSKTFSVKNTDGSDKITATHTFTVLAAPTISTQHAEAKFSIVPVAQAESYLVIENDIKNKVETDNLEFVFDLQSQQRREFVLQAKGDGCLTIDSPKSVSYVFERLATPELTFNNQNNSLTSNLTNNYKLCLNDVDITSSYVFGETLTDLIVGLNKIELIALAADDANVVYINSLPKQLNINKSQADSKLSVVGNKLIIEPEHESADMVLEVEFSTSTDTINFNENNFETIDARLDVKKVGKTYSITLLDDKFNPILSALSNNFTVKVRYVANHLPDGEDTNVTTDYSALKTISFAPKAEFDMAVRDEQNIVFKTALNYTYGDYGLLLNDTYLLLDSGVQVDSENQTIKFDLTYLYNKINQSELKQINKLQLVTLNNKSNEEDLLLSSIGETIYIRKADSISIVGAKNNAREDGNNSVRISFAENETVYDRSVLVKIYNDVDQSAYFETLLVEANPDAKSALNYTFNLDDYAVNLTLVKKIVANIKANSSYTTEIDGQSVLIYVFDSELSNELEYQIVDNAIVETDGTKLIFTLPENVEGVDVFKVEGATLVKLNTNIITDSYNLGINQGGMVLVVRAIAKTVGGFTNSQLSKEITLTKLAQPTISIENGEIVITLDQTSQELFENTVFDPANGVESLDGCVIRYAHGDVEGYGYIYKDLQGVKIENGKIYIESSVLLKYGVTALTKENIKFDVIAQLSTGELVLNSNQTSVDFYGLFAPTKVNLPAVGDVSETKVQTISWTDTELNKLPDGTSVLAGYVLKVVDSEGNEYYSNTNLVYLASADGKDYVATSYQTIISTNNTPFPYGYKTEDGQIEPFIAGRYSIYVKSVPKSGVEGYNLCSSKYSEACQIVILATPQLDINDGVVVWKAVDGATEYILTLEDIFDSSVKQTIILTTTKFEFEGLDNFISCCNIKVKAVSRLANVVSSAESLDICVHRLPTYESLTIDDGVIVMKANGYFTQANLMFRNETTGVTETIKYTNPNYEENMSALQNSSVDNWNDADMQMINFATNYVITIEDSYLLKLSKGSYKLSVKLIGNTSGNLSIANSAVKDETNITKITKLAFDSEKQGADEKTWIRVDERGVFTFASPEEFALGGLNYAFNEQLTDVDYSMFKNVIIYRITININSLPYELFAIDYKSYLASVSMLDSNLIVTINNAGTLCAAVKYPYVDSNGETKYLYFNVFENNQINLNLDNFYYFNTTISTKNGTVSLASGLNTANENGYYSISLIEGGVFSLDLHILGCDITAVQQGENTINQGYLSSNLYSSKSFIRYTDNNLKSYISYTVPTEQPDGNEDANGELNNELGDGETSSSEQPTNEVTYTYSGELIFQNKIKYDENGNALDYPVYQLEINPIVYYDGTAVESQPYVYYLYHDETSVQTVMANNPVENCTEAKAVKVEYLLNNKDYLKFDFSKYFAAGNYSIKIRTLAGVGTDDLDSKYLLNSRLPSVAYSFKRLSNTNLQVVDGKLQFALAYVLSDRVQTYINDYEFIVAENGENATQYSFKIGQNSQGVSIANNILTYILPETVKATDLTTNETADLKLANGKRFNIKVRAVQTEEKDTGILNSTFVQTSTGDKLTAIEKSKGIEVVKIADGTICWTVNDQTNYNGTIIRFEFKDGRVVEETVTAERTLSKVVNGQTYFYYEIGDNEYTCIDGVGKSKINAGVYNLKLRTRGKYDSANNVEILLSDYTEAIEMTRLTRVEAEFIVSQDGVLSWSHPDAEHISGYVVSLTGETNYTFTTTETSIDFASILDDNGKKLEVGNYSIYIRAIGEDYITSMVSSTVSNFTKLGVVTSLNEEGESISWNEVENAQGYKITFSWGNSENTQSVTQTVKAEDGLKCVAPAEMVGNYTIKIQAVGIGTGKVFNGAEYVYEGSSERPESVGEIRFDETDLSLYIPVAKSFKTNDVVRISYKIAAYEFTSSGSVAGNAVEQIVELSQANAEYIQVIDDTTYFVYPLSTAGVYTNIAVNVVRKGSLSSVAAPYDDIYFNYYASGDGSKQNPYGIATGSQFLNIALKPNKNYVMLQAFSLAEIDATAQVKKYGALIANKFTGTLDGGDFALFGLENISVSNAGITGFEGFALFNELENATIKNLNIAETNNNPTKFVNTFAQQQANVLKLSVIAMKATNSTLSNINLKNAIIEIDGSSQLVSDGYIAGLIAIATNTKFEGCIVNLTVKFKADFVPTSGDVYIGGMAASATDLTVDDSDIRSSSVTLAVEQTRTNRRFKAVGGVAGQTTTTTSSQINNVTATINQTTNIYVDHFGGIVGNAIRTNISACTILGNFTHTALDTINLGGVVGQLMGGSVDNCTIKIVFDLTIARYNRIYVGFVAGYATSSNSVMATISNCKINQTFTTKTQFSDNYQTIELMGIYGESSQNNYNPSGCTQIS